MCRPCNHNVNAGRWKWDTCWRSHNYWTNSVCDSCRMLHEAQRIALLRRLRRLRTGWTRRSRVWRIIWPQTWPRTPMRRPPCKAGRFRPTLPTSLPPVVDGPLTYIAITEGRYVFCAARNFWPKTSVRWPLCWPNFLLARYFNGTFDMSIVQKRCR